MDDIIPDRSDTAGAVRLQFVVNSASVLWGSAGSALGSLLFTMYTADISKVVASHGLQLHQYADDCQVYLFFSPDVVPSAVTQLSSYLADVAAWLSASRLRLNPLASPAMGHWGMCPPGACACTPIGQFLFTYNSSGQ